MKKLTTGKIIALLLFCLIQTMAFAQEKQITGTITDAGGTPLPGVSIQIKGTTQGSITDFDGKYTITVPDEATLVYSYVGFQTEQIPVTDQTEIDIVLKEDIMELDEIVVTGYGVTKKSDLTGSMSSLKEEDFNSGNVTTPEQLMQGRISGVQITSNSGEPGSGMNVQIRGANSIRSNTMPLYVIDGVPLDIQNTTPDGATGSGINTAAAATNPLSFLNVNDIESIDVLKDASAAAIYGARAANGVVIITTKKGKEGQANISYSGYASISNLPKKIDVLSAEEFVRFREDSLGQTEYHYGGDTDWQDEIFRTAYTQSHNVALSGGTEQTQYRASFGYLDQEGIVDKTGMKRITGRLNLTQKAINDKLLVEANLTGSQQEFDRAPIGGRTGFEGDLLINAIMANPTMPVRNDTGGYFQPEIASVRNPRAMVDLIKDHTKENRLLGSIAASFEITDGLIFKTNVGMDNNVAARRINQSQELYYLASQGGSGDINNRELSSWLVEHTLSYSRIFSDVHNVSLLAGFSYQNFLIRGYNIHTEGYTSDEILYTNNLDGSDPTLSEPSSYAERNELQSFFGRVNYNLMEKYLVTATFRRDGSTKFGAENKYGNFPSLAVAWRASQEPFIQNLNVFNNLKLRFGWGITGNQEIGSRHSLFSIGTDNGSKAVLDGEAIIPGYVLLRTPNEDIQWESTQQTNIGVDFGFFRGRLSGTIDLFKKQTTDMLLEVSAKLPAPTARQFGNIDGSIINQGIEVGLTGYIIDNSDFGWTVNANFSMIDNTVEDLDRDMIATGQASGPGMTGVDVQVITNGEDINSFYGRKFLGFDENGEGVFQDTDGEEGDDLIILGSPLPDYTFSINNIFTYKNLDLTVFLQGVQGNLIYNNTANSVGTVPNLANANNTFPDVITSGESATNSARFSDRFLEDGSYLRLSNITLGYTVPAQNISWLSNFRIYISGNNLFVITDYSGYDPDVNTDANRDNIASLGIDNTSYPKARSYTVGINVTF
jgi:iron complex outermembrane receptor protein